MNIKKQIDKIFLNEILKLCELNNVKIRFNIISSDNWNPIELFKNNNFDNLFIFKSKI